MNKNLLLTVVVLLVGSFCFSAALSEQQSEDLMRSVKASKTVDIGKPDTPVLEGYYRFSLKLLQSTSARQPENIMVSPLSVYLALAMTANGAQHETKSAMLSTLSDGNSMDEINRTAAIWLNTLETKEKNTVLEIANSIWIQQDYQVAQGFLQSNADFYKAAAKALNFAGLAAAKSINDWVSDATKGKIDSIIDQTSADMLMILINASYFKSLWEDPFETKRTSDRIFHTPSGDRTTAFLNSTRNMQWLEHDGAQGIMLPYNGRRFWFFAIMPDKNTDVRSWLNRQQPQILFSLLVQSVERRASEVELALPKFKALYEDSLLADLVAMGMDIAFKADKADFSLMSAAGTKDLFISDVKHKTFIQVDEEGTEAAAVTSVVMKATAMAPQQIREIVFDRPFFYGILDQETQLPLFIGILDTPKAP
ncbi:MAG: serpin family protein [Sphaerochaetaceae bacterium]